MFQSAGRFSETPSLPREDVSDARGGVLRGPSGSATCSSQLAKGVRRMQARDLGSHGLEKLTTGSLREQAYERLKRLILTNQIPPGQDLIIDQIAKDLGVSHTPVREALAKLELDGLVITARHRTPRVTPISAQDVRETYEMRTVLEGWAAAKAASALTSAEIQELQRRLDAAEGEVGGDQFSAYIETDLFLHETITKAVDNSLFQRLCELISHQSLRIRSLVEARSTTTVCTILREHRSIVDALMAKDADMARIRMTVHLDSARQRTLKALDDLAAARGEGEEGP